MKPGFLLALGILALAPAEVAVFCAASGHSFVHVATLGIVTDHARRPF